LLLLSYSCEQTRVNDNHRKSVMNKYTNDLIHESSPYLLQHAHNPVNWYPWGDKAFTKAKEENKLVIISIGYSACHWCHVMEHESFEDNAVAGIMNDHFVSVKVDREERPDIDQVYMNAAYLIAGTGGWPLNVLALPDGKPFFAGTYFSKTNLIKVLNYFIDIQHNDPSSLADQANEITNGIKSIENVELINENSVLRNSDLDSIFNKLKTNIDLEKGGMKHAPKFPIPSNWEYIMHYYSMSNSPDAFKALTSTLNNMAKGGIYDHIGGGFSRYSTDENWHIPHFEKMLYDNAQLVSLYSHAWQLTKNPLYKNVICQTLDFIEREMTSPEGGFYSSIDADSEGEEGKFYAWTKEEVESILGKEAPLFLDYFDITKSGNWENGKNVLHIKSVDIEISKKYNIGFGELKKRLEKDRVLMFKNRDKRDKPGIDDKILTSWNAIMLKGYVDAYMALGEERFLSSALKTADFLNRNAINKNNEINRNYKNGRSSVPGLLDDYSFTISAFIRLYQATFDEKWLFKANDLADYTILHFFDLSSGMFYYTSDNHSDLIARKMEISDNVIPSSNSEMAMNLFLLGNYFNNESFIQKAKQMLINVQKNFYQNIFSYSNWGLLGIHFIKPIYEVAIVGTDWNNVRKTMEYNYLPDAIFLGGEYEGTLSLLEGKLVSGETTIYVCSGKTCKIPVTKVLEALKQLR
jgi:uncharacterized protein YyaL (SSP411 family)